MSKASARRPWALAAAGLALLTASVVMMAAGAQPSRAQTAPPRPAAAKLVPGAPRRPVAERPVVAYGVCRTGLTQVSPGKRAKSESAEETPTPCSRASAAR